MSVHQADDLKNLESVPGIRQVRVFDCVESTNSTALGWIRTESPGIPALVIARTQTGGRGQSDRPWHSPAGNLMASWIVGGPATGNEFAEWSSGMALAAPLAIVDAIEMLTGGLRPGPQIKWPNDVLIGNRKLAGVLIETMRQDGRFWAVIGIGINVNAPFPEPADDGLELERIATSLLRITGETFGLARLACELTSRLLHRIEQAASDRAALLGDYRNSQWRLGRTITVRSVDRVVRGQCCGVSPSGALLVQSEGTLLETVSGRIDMDPA